MPGMTKCQDCGGPATERDHRDYNRPDDVDPVCGRCNKLRGQGIPVLDKRYSRKVWKLSWVRRPRFQYRHDLNRGKSLGEIASWYGVKAREVSRLIGLGFMMTKKEMLFYQQRRAKIRRMAKKIPQVEIARRFKMTPQRVNQIVNS